jgi:hypothetical protein
MWATPTRHGGKAAMIQISIQVIINILVLNSAKIANINRILGDGTKIVFKVLRNRVVNDRNI